MDGLVIQYHDFEDAKNELKKFSEQTTTDLDLKRVDDSKGLGEFFGDWILGRGIGLNHKVTGEELNELTSQIQSHLCSINNTQITLIKEFGQVYSALEALDKDYIQAILISIKSTEETSKSIQKTQEQIKKIVDNQVRTLEELKKFKQKLDGYAHLEDIDKIWSDCQRWYNEINTLTGFIENTAESSRKSSEKVDAVRLELLSVEERIENLSKQTGILIEKLESVMTFTDSLGQSAHIQDVDKMWDGLSAVHTALSVISEDFKSMRNETAEHQEKISLLLLFMDKLSELEHLTDVDLIWEQTQDNQLCAKELEETAKKHNAKLEELSRTSSSISGRVDLNESEIARLNEYKEKLSELSHLEEVDVIWEDVNRYTSQLSELVKKSDDIADTIQKNKEAADIIRKQAQDNKFSINRLEETTFTHGEKLEELSRTSSSIYGRIDSNEGEIARLSEYNKKLSGISHLEEVDVIWKDMKVHASRLSEFEKNSKDLAVAIQKNREEADSISERIVSNEGEIARLNEYKEKLSGISHLEEVDVIWEDVKGKTSQLSEIEKKNEDLVVAIQKNREETDAKIEADMQETNNAVASLTKKIKYAYIIAGGAAGLAIIELFLLLL